MPCEGSWASRWLLETNVSSSGRAHSFCSRTFQTLQPSNELIVLPPAHRACASLQIMLQDGPEANCPAESIWGRKGFWTKISTGSVSGERTKERAGLLRLPSTLGKGSQWFLSFLFLSLANSREDYQKPWGNKNMLGTLSILLRSRSQKEADSGRKDTEVLQCLPSIFSPDKLRQS